MNDSTITALLIESDPALAEEVRLTLAEKAEPLFNFAWSADLQQSISEIRWANNNPVVLLGPSQSDRQSLDGQIETLKTQAPHLPFIVLSADDDQGLAAQAINQGAQDFLATDHLTPSLLVRVLRYAVERKRSQLALTDSLKQIERAKQEWETTADSLSQVVCLFDRGGRIIRANQAVEQWGLANVVEVRDRKLHDLLHPNCVDPGCYLPRFLKHAWQNLSQGQPAEYEAKDNILKRYVQLQLRPLSSGRETSLKTNISFGAAVIQDITNRKQTEQILIQSQTDLERRVKERTAALTRANQALQQEIAERERAQQENGRLLSETERRAIELAFLNKAGQAMTSTLDVNAVLQQVISEATVMIRADQISVLLRNPVSGELDFATMAGPQTDAIVGQNQPLTTTVADWVVNHKTAALISNSQEDARFYRRTGNYFDFSVRSILAVPIIFRDDVIGVIEATHKLQETFDSHHQELLTALANAAAIAIENARLFEQIRTGREQLRQLTQQVISAQEEERRRLSYELHDEASQNLTALKLWLQFIQDDLPPEAHPINEKIGEAANLTTILMDRLRSLAHDLRPPALDVTGLNDALEDHCHEFAKRTGLTINYTGTELFDISEATMICLYRFLQETLTNVAKHAQARNVRVHLERKGIGVSLTVRDDGCGFEKDINLVLSNQEKGIGLLGIRERLELLDGWLVIESTPGAGAQLTALLPLEQNE